MQSTALVLILALIAGLFNACSSSTTNDFYCEKRKNINWHYRGKLYSVAIQIDQKLDLGHLDFKQTEISTIEILKNGWGVYLHTLPFDKNIKQLANQIKALSNSEKEALELAISFIQSGIKYDSGLVSQYEDNGKITNDLLRRGYKMPYETLRDGRGACFDKSLLALALLRELGFGATLIEMPKSHHIAFGVACSPDYALRGIRLVGLNYLYIESAGPLQIGAYPAVIASQVVDKDAIHFSLSTEGKTYW